MSNALADYDSFPFEFIHGDGCYLVDDAGKKYLDFLGGWCVSTVGWKRREMYQAIAAQAREGLFVPASFRYPPQEEFAQRLVSVAPGKLRRVFRCCSGSEAVEFAIKCARAATNKPTIVSITGVYHGHTYGATSLSGEHRVVEPCEGFIQLPMPKTEEEGEEVIAAFERLICERGDIAAFMSEPVWTNAGCFIPPKGFYAGIEQVCRAHDVLLVMDEVATGMGRCGRLFASELWGMKPDIICLGKALTGGYAVMGATLVTEQVYKKSRGIPSYVTFGWMPQDLAATAKNLDLILKEKLAEQAAETGAYLLKELKTLEHSPLIKEVRGIGMVFSVEFRLPIALIVARRCLKRGLLVDLARPNILFFSPPLVLSKSLAKKGVGILKKACGVRA